MNLRYENGFINGLLGLDVLVKLGVNINLKELIEEEIADPIEWNDEYVYKCNVIKILKFGHIGYILY